MNRRDSHNHKSKKYIQNKIVTFANNDGGGETYMERAILLSINKKLFDMGIIDAVTKEKMEQEISVKTSENIA